MRSTAPLWPMWGVIISVVCGLGPAASRAANLDERTAGAYDGGRIALDELGAELRELRRGGHLLPASESYEKLYEFVTRDLAVRKLLLEEAERLKIRQRPDWSVREILFEQAALAELMRDAVWDSASISEAEVQQFVKDHPDVLLHAPKDEEGKPMGVPTQAEYVTWAAHRGRAAPLMDALREEATSQFPIICLAGSTPQSAAPGDVTTTQPTNGNGPASRPADSPAVFECGTIQFTARDYSLLFDPKWGATFSDCGDLDLFKGRVGEDLPLGELARSKGYRRDPRFEEVLRTHREKWLIEQARQGVVEEWTEKEATSEEQIKDYYENDFKGDEPALVSYDVLIVPAPYSGQSADELKAVKAAAEAKAEQIIARISSGGTSFDDAPKRFDGLQTQYGERRTVQEGTPLADLLKGAEAGQVLTKPYEDFGGFCVIRVNEIQAKRKIPLEYVRGAVMKDLAFRHRNIFRRAFTETLLEKRNFVFNRDLLTRMARQGVKP